MMKRFALTCGLLMILMLGGATPLHADMPEVHLLSTGTFHADEVRVESGESWLALRADEYGFTLKSVTLRVETVYDLVVDADPGKPTGKRVSVVEGKLPKSTGCKILPGQANATSLEGDQPIILLQGVEPPRMGRLQGGKLTNTYLYPSQLLEANTGERYYQLMAYGDAREDNTIYDYRVLVREGEQVLPLLRLATLSLVKSARPKILWIGDLNGDHRLDVLLERSDHYNVSDMVLFLSGEDPWLQEAASFHTTGC